MTDYIHPPTDWNRQAAALWVGGQTESAIADRLAALEGDPDPRPDAFIQPGFYLFELGKFDQGAEILERGLARFPDHPMILLCLGCAYSRTRNSEPAIPLLEQFLALGFTNATAYDALATACHDAGDEDRARSFGSLALERKDMATADRHGTLPLNLDRDPAGKRRIIAFSLFGSRPRYLRGALRNVLAARNLYPGWTCRFHVDHSVDATFRAALAGEGAEVILDTSGIRDLRHLLCRRFLVSDDPAVGHFLVRDCDSVVGEREAAAVAEWLGSGLPFHAMRDWISHTDPMLAGLWGGIAGVFPDMAGAIDQFARVTPLTANWDQFFLREQVWPAVRDQIMVHDRYFAAHAARPFPTPSPAGGRHVGENEFVADRAGQAAALAAFASRVPALALPQSVARAVETGRTFPA